MKKKKGNSEKFPSFGSVAKESKQESFVTDTVGLVLRIEGGKLGREAKVIFEAAEAGQALVYIPAMVFAEILYLSEKQRINVTLGDVAEYMKRFRNYQEYPMNFAVIKSASTITDIAELHDRLIAGTAKLLKLKLITKDKVIKSSIFLKTLW